MSVVAIIPLLAAGGSSELLAARLQMAFTLGFHIVFAALGVGLPVLLLWVEWRWLRTGDPVWRALARRWSKAFAVLFAVGAVSGTVLSFEIGLLWPEFVKRYGAVIGLPFTLEAFAFFLEAIFLGVYLYAWDRLSPRAHWLAGWPIAIAGFCSAFFVVTANAWMNAPAGFTERAGRLVEVEPWRAMFNPAALAQCTHLIVACYMATGFAVAAYYARRRLAGEDGAYQRRAMACGFVLAAALALPQALVGHWAGTVVARTQPAKLAAMEGQFATERGAPLRIGGWPDRERKETRWAIEIPGGLSWLAHGDSRAEVKGLDAFPRADWPPVPVVHLAFQAMVGIGTALLALAGWGAWSLLRRRRLPDSRWFLRCVVASGPLAFLAIQAGWITTEVGRQPWIVQGRMRTAEAVTGAPGVWWVFLAALGVYLVLAAGTLMVLRILARIPLPEAARGA